ncbi:PepSY domain-containing protein [Leptothoe spongobia]|uniref:PepSY domain-containing protein n=1 Tax=Leptothoe spongobia TAU-MAC 1115 TaxID=1967444 RepID=A0A947DHJ8_9CYAN|nr:PepSY domain-containing protein [Leptothoe spongobia]MBT9317183.1 PepSY domain-containing protein [Leptothoe spongobia TAU-MAC 1115]
MVRKGWLGFGILSLAAVGLTACLGEKVPEVELESVPKSELKVSLQEALEIAEATANGKKAYSIERETEEGQPVIEVGIDGHEIFVHATNGEIILIEDLRESEDPEDQEEIEEFLELQSLATVLILDALNTGEEFAGESAHTVELDNEDGSLVYEVVVGRQEIYVDAGTGEVLYVEEDGSAEQAGSIQVPGADE